MKVLSSSALSHPALSRPEQVLLAALLAALAFAACGPSVAQHAQYHAFADQRGWHGLPCAMDVLTNLPFAVAGLWGLVRLWQASLQRSLNAHWQLAGVFFGGLLLTAAGSSYYHWQPDNHGLAWDRLGMVVAFAGLLGMVVAFAGLLGMAVAERISLRAGVATLAATLLAGPVAVLLWYQTGNLLPWVVAQAGGMLLMLALALRQPMPDGWGLPMVSVVALYTLAKLLELGDHSVFGWTAGLVSGHSLKHVVAALAAWPVMAVMHNHAQFKLPQAAKAWA